MYYPDVIPNPLKLKKDVANLLKGKKDVIALTLFLCLILSFTIWVSLLLDGLISDDKNVRTSFLSSMNVSAIKVTEKASCGSEHFCELEGDVRVEAKSGAIYVMTHNETISNSTDSWDIRPYVRWYVYNVRHWTLKVVRYSEEGKVAPKCTQKHYTPAILFSDEGLSLNHFHCYADVVFPLYMTSFGYRPNLQLLVTDYKDWFASKNHEILKMVSQYPLIDIDKENEQVHCYQKMFVGLKFFGDFLVNKSIPEYAAGMSIDNFRQLLRDTYSLKRQTAIEPRLVNVNSPRLLIVSRKSSRILLKEDEISQVAKEVGFNVISRDSGLSTNQSRFAQLVNSCDVLMGVHGAGLTNMLFLPDNAVFIQMLPFGPLDYWTSIEFRDPTWDMNISYLDYRISIEESSLSTQYAPDDPILSDPNAQYAKGWDFIHDVYLRNINFTIDVGRFKGTLVEATKILQH